MSESEESLQSYESSGEKVKKIVSNNQKEVITNKNDYFF